MRHVISTLFAKAIGRLQRSPLFSAPSMVPTWIIFALSMLATALSTVVTHQSTHASRADRFRLQSIRIAEDVQDIMATYLHILRAGAGLFNADADVTAEDWKRFVETLDLERTHPGIHGLGYSKLLRPADIREHLSAMRRDRPNYEIRPPGHREIMTSIVYIEPRTWRNDLAIGYDMYSEGVRRVAMIAASDTGFARMTRSVTLVQEGMTGSQHGVLVYFPTYAHGANLNTQDDRRAAASGFVYAAFRMQDLFERAIKNRLSSMLRNIVVQLYDSDDADDTVELFSSLAAPLPGITGGTTAHFDGLTESRYATVAGQKWYFKFFEQPGFATLAEKTAHWIVLAVGSAISILIASIAAALTLSQLRMASANVALQNEISMRQTAQQALQQANYEVRISNQELVHRVKNMMAVVSSIATQTARYSPDPAEFNSAFRERLAALGRVHDFLKPNPIFRPDLKTLVPEILRPYANSETAALTLEGPTVEITQSTAVMLSLVINELSANAVRHGAWSRATGRVIFCWRLCSDASGQRTLDFSWHEQGGPPVFAPPKLGFGSNVLKYSIERGLGGTFKSSYEADGFLCAWTIPAGDSSFELPTREF